jgi:hypothetical protein
VAFRLGLWLSSFMLSEGRRTNFAEAKTALYSTRFSYTATSPE